MCKERKKSGVSIAFLCTPTDIHLCPKEAVDGARENLHSLPVSIKFMKAATGLFGLKSMLVANVAKPVGNLHYVEGLVSAQVVQPASPYHHLLQQGTNCAEGLAAAQMPKPRLHRRRHQPID